MRHFITTAFILFLFSPFNMAGQNDNTTMNDIYAEKEFESQREERMLLYRQLNPLVDFSDCGKPDKKYPLIVFLHGAGERGNDNKKQLIHGAKLFADIENRVNHPAFVIFPQCPENERWVDVDWSLPAHDMPAEPSDNLSMVYELVQNMKSEYPIDTARIYVIGLSMGGYGTWDYASRYPDELAAAVPICGGGDEKQAEKIKDVPFWIFHGSDDKIVPPERSRNMVKALKSFGGKPIFTEYPDVGHLSWNKAFAEPELLDWLFSQTLKKR